MLGQFLVRFRKGAAATFDALLGTDHAHLWAQFYSKPTSTTALYVDEGVGGKNATHVTADATTIPTVGTINGKACPIFLSEDSNADELQATPFNTLDGSNSYTLYGALVAFDADYGGTGFTVMAQSGSFEVTAEYNGGTGKVHIKASIDGGNQFTPSSAGSALDDGVLHYWALTVNGGVGKLFVDGVQIGADVPGLPALDVGNVNPVKIGTGNSGGIYLSGIATRGLNTTEVSTLFSLMSDYIGTLSYPTLTSGTSGGPGATITLTGTNFVSGARVFFRDTVSSTWVEGDNTTFVSDTQIDVDIPLTLTPGALDVWILNGDGLWVLEEDLVSAIPQNFGELFGANDSFRWGHLYSKPTATSALWENEGSVAGWDATEQIADATRIPLVGSFAGSPFPFFLSIDGGLGDGLWTADNFDGVDDQTDVTFYGAFTTLAIADGADSFVLMEQAGHFKVYLWWGGDNRFHLFASLGNGEQWNVEDATDIVDNGLVNTWALTVKADGSGKLFINGTQIGSTVTGLTGIFAGTNVNSLRFGRSVFDAPTGGIYLNGIARKSLSDEGIGFLFDLIDAYVGTATAPNVTGTTPNMAPSGTTISVTGTGFVNAALVYLRLPGNSWYLADNITFVSATQIDCDVPSGPADGLLDVMVMNPSALYENQVGAFTKGAVGPVISAIEQVDPAGGDVTLITVDDSTGMLSGTLDGDPQPVFVIDATTVAMVTPKKATGTYAVTLTNGSGTSAPFNIAYFTNVDADTTARWVRGNYSGIRFHDDSGNHFHLSDATVYPLEDVKEPKFNITATNQLLTRSSFTWADLVAAGLNTYSISMCIRMRKHNANLVTVYQNSSPFTDGGAYAGLFISDTRVVWRQHDGTLSNELEIATTLSLYEDHVIDIENNAGSMRMRIDGGAWSAPVSGGSGIGSTAFNLRMGQNHDSSKPFYGDVRGIIVSKVARGNTWFDNNLVWWKVKQGFRRAAGAPELHSYDDVHDPSGTTRIFGRGKNLGALTDGFVGDAATTNVVNALAAVPKYNGLNTKLLSALNTSSFVSTGTGTISVLCLVRSAPSPSGAGSPYNNPSLAGTDGGGYVLLGVTNAGIVPAVYDGAYKETPAIPFEVGTWIQVDMRWNGTILEGRVNGGAWKSIATAGPDNTGISGSLFKIGANYNNSLCFDGIIAEVLVADAALSDATLNNVLAGRNYDFGFRVGNMPAAAFDRATITASGLWKAGDYSLGSWAATASAGASGGRTVTEATNKPVVYSHAAKRFAPFAASPEFNGIDHYLQATTAGITNYVSNGAGSIGILFYSHNATAGAAVNSKYTEDGLFADANGNVCVTISKGGTTPGLSFSAYNTGTGLFHSITLPVTHRTPHYAQIRWNGTQREMRIDGGPWTVLVQPITNLAAGNVFIGKNFTSKYFNGVVWEVQTESAYWSDGDANEMLQYINYKYGLALGGFGAVDFDPSTRALTAWVQPGNYVLGTLTGSASAGASGGRNFTEPTTPPRVADNEFFVAGVPARSASKTAIGDHPICNGTTHNLTGAGTLDTYYNGGVYSGWMVFTPYVIVGNSDPGIDQGYLNDVLIGTQTNGWWVMTLRTGGAGELGSVNIRQAGASSHNITVSGIKLNATNIVRWRCSANTMYLSVNGGPWSTLDITGDANIGVMTQPLMIAGGVAYSTNEFNGEIHEVGLSDTDLGQATLDNVLGEVQREHGLIWNASIPPVTFDRASLSLTAYWKPGSYATGTWTGTASAGTSGSNNATEVTNPPGVTKSGATTNPYPLVLINAAGVAANTNGVVATNPGNMGGNVFWLRADRASVDLDASGYVTTWYDQSGLGDANRNGVNGSPGTWFTPPWNPSEGTYGGRPTIGPFTERPSPEVCLLRTGTWSASYALFSLGAIGHAPNSSNRYFTYEGGTDYNALVNSTGTVIVYSGAADANIATGWPGLASMPQAPTVFIAGFNAGNSRVWPDKEAAVTGILNTHTLGDAPLHVGSYQGDGSLFGVTRLGEVFAFSRILSDDDARTLIHYKGTLYGKAA